MAFKVITFICGLGQCRVCCSVDNFLILQLTYVDIGVFQVLRATEFQFPEEYKSLDITLLRGFKQRMQERPRIKAFLESERSQQFCGNSMM